MSLNSDQIGDIVGTKSLSVAEKLDKDSTLIFDVDKANANASQIVMVAVTGVLFFIMIAGAAWFYFSQIRKP